MEPATARRIIEHMNDDHYQALGDYVRHFGRISANICDVTLRSITFEAMRITYRNTPSQSGDSEDDKESEIVIPFEPALASAADARPRLVGMAKEAAIARIPRPKLPGLAAVIFCIFGLGFMWLFGFHPEKQQVSQPLLGVKKAYEILFLHSYAAMRATFILSVGVHILEGFYAAYAMKRAARSFGVLLYGRAIFWIVSTTIFGVFSLTMLNEGIGKLRGGRNINNNNKTKTT